MTRYGRRNLAGSLAAGDIVRVISLSVIGIIAASLFLLGIAAIFAVTGHAQTVYVPPGVVIEQPRHHYEPPPPYPYCDRDCQWHRYHVQRERDRERNSYYYRDWR